MTSPTPQDGEGLVTEAMVWRASAAVADYSPGKVATHHGELRAALAAVAPDIAAAARKAAFAELLDGAEQRRGGPAGPDDPAALLAAQVRRQCAEELRNELGAGLEGILHRLPQVFALPDRWSPQSTEGDRDVHSHPDR